MPRTPAPSSNAKTPVVGRPEPRSRRTAQPQPADLPLPHERDETTRRKAHPADPAVEQAQRDLAAGQQDTDRRGDAAEVFDRRWAGRKKP